MTRRRARRSLWNAREEGDPPAKADPREITLHVDGMSEQLNLI